VTDNINTLLEENGVRRDVDLLSIDIDGNDYWIWQAIQVVQPRVIVIEYNALWVLTAASARRMTQTSTDLPSIPRGADEARESQGLQPRWL